MATLIVSLQIYMNKKNTKNLLKLQIFLFISEALSMCQLLKRNVCNFNKFCVLYITCKRSYSLYQLMLLASTLTTYMRKAWLHLKSF